MAKPILVVRLPQPQNADIQREQKRGIIMLTEKMPDWHIIPIADWNQGKWEFEAYHDKNATDIEIDEIKTMALKILEDASTTG